MTRVARALREMFLRPADRPRALEPPPAWPDNVVPLRVGVPIDGGDAVRRTLSERRPRTAATTEDLAPRVALVSLAGVGERWLALAIAGELRRTVDAAVAFVVDAGDPHERGSVGEARLRLGAARVLLPFAARRHSGRVLSIDVIAARRHEQFLRALGPVVWSIGAVDGREALRELVGEAQAIVLARPGEVDPAYSEILATELRTEGMSCGVIRVVTGRDRAEIADDHPAGEAAGGELVVPCGTLDRWLVDRGLPCGPATRRGVRLIAEAVQGGRSE